MTLIVITIIVINTIINIIHQLIMIKNNCFSLLVEEIVEQLRDTPDEDAVDPYEEEDEDEEEQEVMGELL